jgi:hypothetical protein
MMRTLRGRAIAILAPVAFVAPLACFACGGGGGESGSAKTAADQPADSAAASSAPPSQASAADAGAATTTVALGNGGDLQGAKLTETHTVASTTASAASSGAAPKGPHAHEPGRGPEDIRAIIMARRDDARACYDAAIKDHPGIEGDLVITWTIDPKGNVTQVGADSSRSQISEATTIACISDVIKKIQFAGSPGGYETKAFYPFNFHPHHGSGTAKP